MAHWPLPTLLLPRCAVPVKPPIFIVCCCFRMHACCGLFQKSRLYMQNDNFRSALFRISSIQKEPALCEAFEVETARHAVDGLPASRQGNANAATLATVDPSQTFWTMPVKPTALHELIRRHSYDRAVDKRSRFMVRNRLREDGVVSNLYPIFFSKTPNPNAEGAGGAFLYVYNIHTTRVVAPAPNDGKLKCIAARRNAKKGANRAASASPPPLLTDDGMEIRRVAASAAWSVIHRFLLQYFAGNPPPMVQLLHKLYTTAPLPTKALKVPEKLYDLGWKTCELQFSSRLRYDTLDPHNLQEVVNKIVIWAASPMQSKQTPGDTFRLVREKKGKFVHLESGIATGGARLFNGMLVQAIFVDASHSEPTGDEKSDDAAVSTAAAMIAPPARPHSTALATLPAGSTPLDRPVLFLVESFLRAFTYKGQAVESYRIADASGAYLASVWQPKTPQALQPGQIYAAKGLQVQIYPNRQSLRLFECHEGVTTLTATNPAPAPAPAPAIAHDEGCEGSLTAAKLPKTAVAASAASVASLGETSVTSGGLQLVLKMDAKGTFAAEQSLWGEVVGRYGAGPYDETARAALSRLLCEVAVVSARNLRQGVIRLLQFDGERFAQADAAGHRLFLKEKGGVGGRRGLPPGIATLLAQLDPRQPWAVLSDHSTLPLQLLHRCFEPKKKGWQQAAIANFSLLPPRRLPLLANARRALAEGLWRWGLRLAEAPLRTRRLSVLPAPEKAVLPSSRATPTVVRAAAAPATNAAVGKQPRPFPAAVVVVAVAGPRCSAEESQRLTLTAQQLGTFFHAIGVASVDGEAAAVRFIVEQLQPHTPSQTVAHNSRQWIDEAAVVVLTTEPDSRATRWLLAECLSRGVLPIWGLPATTPARARLLSGNLRRQLCGKFETNPLRGVDLGKEVPVIAGQRVLFAGVDACHTNTMSTGSVVGILYSPERNHLIPRFWRHAARGLEVQSLSEHLQQVLKEAAVLYGGLDQVVIFQDGNVFSELNQIKELITTCMPDCGLTFMCLHKRSNIRFVHDHPTATSSERQPSLLKSNDPATSGEKGVYHNIVKGTLIPALTPVSLDYEVVAPTFYLQTHDSPMSTARIVKYTVHHVSPTLDITDVQHLANVMANVLSPHAAKLPISTHCAHRLADFAERLLDAVPQFQCEMIPLPLRGRLWFM